MRSELSHITKEAESRQDQIQGFLSAFIPEYKNHRNSELSSSDSRKSSISCASDNKNSQNLDVCNDARVRETISTNKFQEKSLQKTKKEVENSFERKAVDHLSKSSPNTIPTIPDKNDTDENNPFSKNLAIHPQTDDGQSLPLPTVEYNWKERDSKLNGIPGYLPRLGKSNINHIIQYTKLLLNYIG